MSSGSDRGPEASTVKAVQAPQNSDVRAFVKEPAALPMLWDATFEQWRDNHTEPTHTIMSLHPSVWDREDVLPVGILYGGMGGVSGIPCSHDGKYSITAVTMESTESACHTHRLNNPSVPVLQMRITSASETKAAVAKFIPRKHWYRLWLHGSNSCKRASTANMGGRDISAALNDTIFAIQVMQKFNAAIWALENVSELHQFFKGKYPTAHVFNMKQHCRLAQEQKRMILSNRMLFLNRATEDVTVRDVLGKHKGWDNNARLWMRNAWGYVRSVDSPKGSYSVTSGYMLAGAGNIGDFGPQHILSADDRALLQGYSEPPKWPADMPESARRAMVAQVVPPPFAEQLFFAVRGHQVAALEKARLFAKLAALNLLPEHELASEPGVTLPSDWVGHVGNDGVSYVGADGKVFTGANYAGLSGTKHDSIKLGKHGSWKSLGEFGWCKASVPDSEHVELVRSKPWMICTTPPKPSETYVQFHARRQREKVLRIHQMLEQAQMESEDSRLHGGTESSVAAKLSHHFVNTHPDPNLLHARDSNAELQRTQPEWYGPFLAEGECYTTPRTKENVAAACKAVGLDELSAEDAGERQFFADLIRELWVLFDGKLREIAGVEIDLDLSDVKPIRAHPYRWSPAKVKAGRELAAEFLEDGIIRPITSEWGAPALIVAKPKGGWRLVVDLRELNKVIPHDVYEPPSCDLCLEWLAGKPYRTTADMRWGFHQVAL